MKNTTLILSLVATLALIGCGKDDAAGGGGGGKLEPLKLDILGLTVDAPKGANQSELMGDIMVQAPGTVFSVRVAGSSDGKTIAEAKENASMFSPKNIAEEKLADGFVLRYENKGSMGANYFVNVRRTIGGKDYFCTATSPNDKMAANAAAACKSLRP